MYELKYNFFKEKMVKSEILKYRLSITLKMGGFSLQKREIDNFCLRNDWYDIASNPKGLELGTTCIGTETIV
jgi:hypothetical protein